MESVWEAVMTGGLNLFAVAVSVGLVFVSRRQTRHSRASSTAAA